MRHLFTSLLQLAATLVVFSRQAISVSLPTLPLVIGTRGVCESGGSKRDPIFMERTTLKDESGGFRHMVLLGGVVSDLMDRISGYRLNLKSFIDGLDNQRNVIYFIPDDEYGPRSIILQTHKLQSQFDHHMMNATIVPLLYTEAETKGVGGAAAESQHALGIGFKRLVKGVRQLKKVKSQSILVHGKGVSLLPSIQKQHPVEKKKDKESQIFSGRKLASIAKKVHILYDTDDKILKRGSTNGRKLLGLTGMTGVPDARCDNVLQVDCSDYARFSDPYQHHYFYNTDFAMKYMKTSLYSSDDM